MNVAAIVGIAITIWVLYLYRRRKLTEDQAILWLFTSISVVLFSTMPDLLWLLRWLFGWETAVTELMLAAFIGFLLIISIYYSVKISELSNQNEKLVQELALVKASVLPLHQDERKRKASSNT